MTKEQAITKAKEIYKDLGSDPQVAFAIIRIARFLRETVSEEEAETEK